MQLVWRDTAQVTSKNVELVRKDLEYWNRGDIDAFVGLWDDDVVLRAAEGWPGWWGAGSGSHWASRSAGPAVASRPVPG